MRRCRADLAALAFVWLSSASAADAEPTLCTNRERVVFSCRAAGKIVSICATPDASSFTALEYRFGAAGKIELAFRAAADNGNRFRGYLEPAAPAAMIHHVWFDRGKYRYLVAQCTGGDCPAKAGLIVYESGKAIRTAACDGGFAEHAWFDPAVIDFGSTMQDSTSHTPLLILEETASDLQSLFPYRSAADPPK